MMDLYKDVDYTDIDLNFLELLELYKSLFDLSEDAKVLIQKDKIVKMNKSFLELTGKLPGQIKDLNFVDFLENYNPSWNIKLPSRGEYSIVMFKSGTYLIPVLLTFNVLILKGEETHIITIKDISKLKQLEDKLFLFTTVIENITSAIVITDSDGNIEWVNKAFTDLTGYQKKEILGETPRILKSGKHTEDFYKKMWDIISSGRTWKGEVTNKKKDGTLYEDSQLITPIKDHYGNITNYIAIKQDPYILKFMKNLIEENEDYFREITNRIPDGIYVHTIGGKILDVNNAVLDYTGYTRKEILKLMVKDIDAEFSQNEIIKKSKGLTEGDSLFESVHITKDGKEIPVEIHLGLMNYRGETAVISVVRAYRSK